MSCTVMLDWSVPARHKTELVSYVLTILYFQLVYCGVEVSNCVCYRALPPWTCHGFGM